VGAGQALEEVRSVLDADGVEEECEAEVPEHRRRRRLRREPAHPQRHEQHGPDAQGEPLDADFADEIADRDREEEGHQRLLLQHGTDEFHGPPSDGDVALFRVVLSEPIGRILP
jgi:hypothetical protein